MTTLSWYARRLARMSPAEMAGRIRDEAVRRRWRRRQVRDDALDPLSPPAVVAPFAAWRRVAVDEVPAVARAGVLVAADELLAGRWKVFARVRDDMTPAPDWFSDPRTGLRAPPETYCFDVDHRREEALGNVKYLWETSRQQHCTVLAAAWYLSGDERYAQAVASQLTSWWQRNPFLSGVHWTSGIELGIRLVSWVWVRRLLDGWAGSPALFESNPVFLRQLHHHQEYLAVLPSRGSSANNHVIAEMAGQFSASCAFPWFPESARWRDRATAALRRELPRQTFPDGLNRELATAYHGFALELGLVAALEGERVGHPLGVEVWETLRRMSDAIAAVVDVRLRPPRQGDDDEGCALLVDHPGFDPWASLLSTGAVLFGPLDWWPEAPRDDVRTALLTRLAAPPVLHRERPVRRPSMFPDAGLVLLRDQPGRPDEMWCRVDAGPHGYLSIAAHAHADALAVEVRVGGVDVLTDPGTYCYHGEPQFRSWFRSTLGHNTLEIGGHDQSVPAGPFLWTRHARARLEKADGLDGGPTAVCRGAHYGYGRLHPPAVHRRTVRLDRIARQLEIEDRLDSAGEHDVRLALHLGPDINCTLDGHLASLSWDFPDSFDGDTGAATLTLPKALSWVSLRGRTDPPAGWYSPAFDVLVPAVTLIGVGRLGRGLPLRTVLSVEVMPPRREPARGLASVPGPPPIREQGRAQ